jgi:hypothetical protein
MTAAILAVAAGRLVLLVQVAIGHWASRMHGIIALGQWAMGNGRWASSQKAVSL